MKQPFKLKYEKKPTRKFSIDSSERQCIVHFENYNKEVGGLTETGFEVARKRLTYASQKDRQEFWSADFVGTLIEKETI